MRQIVIATTLVGVLVVASVDAQSGYQLLQQGLSQEQGQGNLQGAIAIYQRIVKEHGSDRALAAQALLRLGDCYQKLGDAQARQMFERVVREYADQSAAVAAARARLSGDDAVAKVRGDRPVWSGGLVDGFGTVSPDGRYLTYTDWHSNAALMVHDFSTGTNRRLTPAGIEGGTQFSTISPDGRQVAYQWLNAAGRYEVRTASLLGTGTPESKRVIDLEDAGQIAPYSWSPDGTWIAVSLSRRSGAQQIALVRVADGSLRELRSFDTDGPTRIAFSPDGQYIAYDLAIDERRLVRHIYVTSVDGGREALVVDDHSGNAVMGWAPDGRSLLFASDRSGSVGLWAMPITNGRAAGSAILTKRDIGTMWSNGISAAGTMYVWKSASPIYVQTAPIDLSTGRLTGQPSPANRIFISSRGRPAWSADGRELAYVSCGSLGGGPCRIFVRSVESGQTRELNTRLWFVFSQRFSPDGRSLIAQANAPGTTGGVFRVDVQSGETTLLVAKGINPQWLGPDKFLYQRRTRDTLTLIEHDLASGMERQVLQAKIPGVAKATVSPDNRYVAAFTQDNSGSTLSLISVASGETRALLRVATPGTLLGADSIGPEWTPDSRNILVIRTPGADHTGEELWRVPADGSAPSKLEIDVTQWVDGGVRLSADGRQIAFVAASGRTGEEIWALENFLPAR